MFNRLCKIKRIISYLKFSRDLFWHFMVSTEVNVLNSRLLMWAFLPHMDVPKFLTWAFQLNWSSEISAKFSLPVFTCSSKRISIRYSRVCYGIMRARSWGKWSFSHKWIYMIYELWDSVRISINVYSDRKFKHEK